MKSNSDIVVTPWPHDAKLEKRRRLAGARLAWVCEWNLGVAEIEEAAFFRRTATQDELWIVAGLDLVLGNPAGRPIAFADVGLSTVCNIGLAVAAPKVMTPPAACARLLEALIRARVGFAWPGTFIAAGIVAKPVFNNLTRRIERELDENARKAQHKETEIIEAARKLGLAPRPAGADPDAWQATCPETNHFLEINAATNFFWCGWCKRKGSLKELQAFAKERRRWKTGQSGAGLGKV
jgi:hypothetical protein